MSAHLDAGNLVPVIVGIVKDVDCLLIASLGFNLHEQPG